MIAIDRLAARAGAFTLRADLALPAGAICALTGPSGGGKSTLLNAVAGFAPVGAGAILVDGRDLAGLKPAERPVTMLFQENNLFPHLSAFDNVALGLPAHRARSRGERDAVAAALAECGLDGLADRLPDALSGGQRSRVALARALLRDRPALLLDEPFSALGPALRREMMALLRRIVAERGAAAILATHHPDEVVAADLAAFCADGRVAGAMAPQALIASPQAQAYFGG